MRKFLSCGLIVLMGIALPAASFAQVKSQVAVKPLTSLLIDLNRTLVTMVQLNQQYELRVEQLQAQMPYQRIIPERKRHMNDLANLIIELGGTPEKPDPKKLITEPADDIYEALLIDAAGEVQMVEIYNMLLIKYKDPRVQDLGRFWRDQSNFFYMMFNNISNMSMFALLRSIQMGEGRLPEQGMAPPGEFNEPLYPPEDTLPQGR